MTPEEKKLGAFFENAIRSFGNTFVDFHFPRRSCFDGTCARSGLKTSKAILNQCNWEALHALIEDFFKTAPDVTEDWKAMARRATFCPDELHDILIGVFLGVNCPNYPYPLPEDCVSATKAKRIMRSVTTSFLRENPYPLEEIP